MGFCSLRWGDIGGFALQRSGITPLRFYKDCSGLCVENREQSSKIGSKETSWETVGILGSLVEIWAAESSREALKNHQLAHKHRALDWFSPSSSKAV